MSLCSKAIADRLRKLFRDVGGNVGLIFAFALLPILLATGSAIDYGHYNSVRVRIQAALDATGLMLAHNIGTMPNDELLALAEQFFAENFPPQAGVDIADLQTTVMGDRILLVADATVDTFIMHLANVPYLKAHVESEITRAEDSFEVVLVLDNTGSMAGSKITALKDAATLLTNNLFGETSEHPLLTMALVPFSHAVNVGTGNKNATWMDTQALNPIHKELFSKEFADQGLTRFDLYDRIGKNWPGCVEARAYPLDVNDTAASSGNPDSLFVPYFAPDEPGNKNDPLDDYNNSYIKDVLDETQKKPKPTNAQRQEYTAKYSKSASVGSGGPGQNCTANPILSLTNRKADLIDALDDMKADGYTNITEGLMWGLRVISPGEPFTDGKPYDTEDHHKIIVLLTDGKNEVPAERNSSNMVGSDNHNKSVYGPYGYAASGRLVNTRNKNTFMTKMNERTAEACEAVKDEGIELFTITFQVGDTATEDLMRDCATKPDMYYNSPDSATLKKVFKAIATRISELRISK